MRSDSAIVRAPSASLEHARARANAPRERHLPRPPACPPLVSEAMRYSVFAGGKRLRPALALPSADAVARQGTSSLVDAAQAFPDAEQVCRDACSLALPAACALELIHTYLLMHHD